MQENLSIYCDFESFFMHRNENAKCLVHNVCLALSLPSSHCFFSLSTIFNALLRPSSTHANEFRSFSAIFSPAHSRVSYIRDRQLFDVFHLKWHFPVVPAFVLSDNIIIIFENSQREVRKISNWTHNNTSNRTTKSERERERNKQFQIIDTFCGDATVLSFIFVNKWWHFLLLFSFLYSWPYVHRIRYKYSPSFISHASHFVSLRFSFLLFVSYLFVYIFLSPDTSLIFIRILFRFVSFCFLRADG